MKPLIIIPALMMLLTAAMADPAAAEIKYHPGDVAVINRLLQINDAENGRLAQAGWEIGRPQTWVRLPGRNVLDFRLSWGSEGRLESVVLHDVELTGSLDLTGLERLFSLELPGSRLNAIRGLADLKRLTYLDLSRNLLTSVGDLGGLTRLSTLYVSHNELTGLGDLSGLAVLHSLSVNDNRLTDLGDLGALENLDYLQLSNNRLTRPPDFSKMKRLRNLFIAGNPFENYHALETLNWNGGLSFGYSVDQLPEFSLAGKNPQKLLLSVWEAPKEAGQLSPAWSPPGQSSNPVDSSTGVRGQASVDLAGRKLDCLSLVGHLSSDLFRNPGPVDSIFIAQDHHYSMVELRALAEKFNPGQLLSPTPQTTSLGDVAAGLKTGTAYRLEDVSPRLAEEYAAAGLKTRQLYALAGASVPLEPESRLLLVSETADFESVTAGLQFDFGFGPEPNDISPADGLITFGRPGEFRLVLVSGLFHDQLIPYITVGYLDPIKIEAKN